VSRRKTIGENPLDVVIPTYRAVEPAEAGARRGEPRKKRLTVYVPAELIERARDAVYWTSGLTLSDLVAEALERRLAEMERERGGGFPPRPSRLRPGRPVR